MDNFNDSAIETAESSMVCFYEKCGCLPDFHPSSLHMQMHAHFPRAAIQPKVHVMPEIELPGIKRLCRKYMYSFLCSCSTIDHSCQASGTLCRSMWEATLVYAGHVPLCPKIGSGLLNEVILH